MYDNSSLTRFRESRYLMPPWDQNDNKLGFGHQHDSDNRCDISAHMPLLKFLANKCTHVTEFGTRDCCSTIAFLDGLDLRPSGGKLVSYDIKSTESIQALWEYVGLYMGSAWEFNLRDTTDPTLSIEPTDLLFIDTLHCYRQLKKELALHSGKVRKWIVLHDVVTDAVESLDAGGVGIGPAISEFLADNLGVWQSVYFGHFNHGLQILEKII